MKIKLMPIAFLVLSGTASASLPTASTTVSDPDKMVSLLSLSHSELENGNCIKEEVLEGGTSQARFAVGDRVTAVSITYNSARYGRGRVEVRVQYGVLSDYIFSCKLK